MLESRANGRQVFTENGVKALSTLTAKDLALQQDVWDYVNTYWPDIAARKRRTGLEPAKVRPNRSRSSARTAQCPCAADTTR